MKNNENSIIQLTKLNNLCDTKKFLGKEFLSWLWFQIESNEMPIKINAIDSNHSYDVDIWIDDRVVLESTSTTAHTQSLRGGTPSKSAEAAAALKTGKAPKEMKVSLIINSQYEFSCVLNQKDLFPKNIQIPPMSDDEDDRSAESHLEARLKLLNLFLNAFDALYSKFLHTRTHSSWDNEELSKIKKWIQTREQTEA
jgi:hypothetical protein